ncbi:MAG TPA: right-handed parallel beta-helix repeat-containing protein [Xanthomonadaceae bacterium]|nr:right-handed parallel beta-helix repeat-containing protein [Xanthomonadaceae bacterium]
MNFPTVLSMLVMAALCGTAHAATFTVNRTDVDAIDVNPGDGICSIDALDPVPQCTLRAAVMEANALAGHDTILVPPGELIDLTLAGDGGAEVGDLLISDHVDILGFVGDPPASTAALPVIEASPLGDRIFRIAGGRQVLLRGLHLQGGNASSGSTEGGAVRNLGHLRVEHSVLTFNQASLGGALYTLGPNSSLLVRGSHFEGNRISAANGAAINVSAGSAQIIDSSFRDNRADPAFGSTIRAFVDLLIENSTLDGTPLSPPVAGLGSPHGVSVNGSAETTLRNVTVTGFEQTALRLNNLDAAARIRVSHSVLAAGVHACRANGDLAAADVVIAHSMVESELDCAAYYEQVHTTSPQLGTFVQQAGTATWYRPPDGPFANVVDAGMAPDMVPSEPVLGCAASDQRGLARPQDGSAAGTARCDLGAIELEAPLTFIVDHFDEDLVDTHPGNGVCDIDTLVPGATCTLRAAVMEANALPGLQVIRFIDGVHTALLDRAAAADASGGDLDVDEVLVIEGRLADGVPVTSIEQTVAGERVFDLGIITERPVALRQLRLTGGSSDVGGAVRIDGGASLRIERSELEGNHAGFGGGALAVLTGSLLVVDSDLHGNSTNEFGAALGVGSDGLAVVSGSSVRNNTNFDLPVGNVAEAIYVASSARLSLLSSTVSDNSGGIFAELPGSLQVVQSTVADNGHYGILGVFDASTQSLGLVGSIVAGHGAGVAAAGAKGGIVPTDCLLINAAAVANVQHEYMLSQDDSCSGMSATSFAADPLLGPMQRPPGRLSRVRIPTYGDGLVSPALDVAPAHLCPRTDQRGQARPVDLVDVSDIDGSCDLGAVEVDSDRLFANGFED